MLVGRSTIALWPRLNFEFSGISATVKSLKKLANTRLSNQSAGFLATIYLE